MKRVLFLLAGIGLAGGLLFAGGKGETKQEQGPIVIGAIQDLSGPTSVWGNAVRKGAELAVERINAAGGINGRKITT